MLTFLFFFFLPLTHSPLTPETEPTPIRESHLSIVTIIKDQPTKPISRSIVSDPAWILYTHINIKLQEQTLPAQYLVSLVWNHKKGVEEVS